MRRTGTAVVAGLVIVAAGVGAAKWPRPKPVQAAKTVETAQATVEDFDVTLRVSGVLGAAKTAPIVNWAQQTQIVWVLPDGSWVKAGEVVMKMNVATAKKQLTEAERQQAQGEQRGRTQVEEARRRLQNATAGLQKTKDDLRLMQLQCQAAIEKATAEGDFNDKEVEVARGEYDKYKRLADAHLVPITRLEAMADQVRGKEFAREKAGRELARSKQEAEVNEKVKQLEVSKAELELESARAGLAQAEADAGRALAMQGLQLQEAAQQVTDCEIKADSPGMLLLESKWDMAIRKLRVGDDVSEGTKVASIIDPRKMLVQCDVGEADISRVRVGQKGVVQVPAIGDKQLRGTLQAIDNLAREGFMWEGGTPGKRVFNVTLTLREGDPRLRPGMSGTVEIAIDRAEKALAVPAEALFEQEGKAFVYRRKGDLFEAVPVKVTRRSEMLAAVMGSLKPGDVLACERPPANQIEATKERKR